MGSDCISSSSLLIFLLNIYVELFEHGRHVSLQ